MRLTGISVANYRSFADEQRIDLAPVTLFYGDNSAGKSALVRLLPFLDDSCRPELTTPLDWTSAALRGASFDDLRWKGLTRDDDPDLRIKLFWSGRKDLAETEFRVGWARELERVLVREFRCADEKERDLVHGEWAFRASDRQSVALTYEVKASPQRRSRARRLLFRGLHPVDLESEKGLSHGLSAQASALRLSVQWLSARHAPPRSSPRPEGPLTRLLVDGSDVDRVLASNDAARREVSAWCEQHLHLSVQTIEAPPKEIRLVVRQEKGAAFDVDVLDAGEGIAKILPVLTAMAVSKIKEGAPSFIAVEEPESHLHPRLQRALAAHVAEWVKSKPSSRLVLETHSQHLLLGLQIAVAKGDLRPDDVCVYWVHRDARGRSTADPVRMNDDGRLVGNWPPDVYTEVNDMAAELLEARRTALP
jgi:predicted ATPase